MNWRESFSVLDGGAVYKGQQCGIDLTRGSLRKRDMRMILSVKEAFPGAHKSGYALRSRVVWWLYTGEVLVGDSVNLHHKNHNRADDRFENLEKLGHVAHAKEHNPKTVRQILRSCEHCGSEFYIPEWRVPDVGRGRFCSMRCKSSVPKGRNLIRKTCMQCGTAFEVVPSRMHKAKYCSYRCGGAARRKIGGR